MAKLYLFVRRYLTVLLVCVSFWSYAQKTVSGRITSGDDKSGLPGVNVLEKGTQNGTITDADGNFTIRTGDNATLVLSFIGYKTQEVTVGSQTAINVVLENDVTALSEVVVIGYGSVQKKDATGAVTALNNKDFNRGVLTSPQDLILGKIAGVSIISNSGAPGDNSTIRIRGGSSLGASNDPLIVIDGFPVDNTYPGGVANPLATLNPNDIESFTVLKDASATAIYGSRASNGVIIVTTKKGVAGKAKFSYNGNVSIASPIKYVDVLDGPQFRSLVNTLAQTGQSGIDAAAVAKLGTANTNWQKEIFRNAISHDHNLNVSGAYKTVPYRISYGYTDQQGILKTTSTQRNSLNVNLNPTLLNGDLKLNMSAKGNYTLTNFGEPGAVGSAVAFDPTQPIYSPADTQYGGYFSWLSKGVTNGTSNPVAQLNQTDNRSKSNRIIANLQAEYAIRAVPGLKINVNTGFDRAVSHGFNNVPITGAFAQNNGILVGRTNTYWGRNQSELLDIYLNYTKQLGLHKLEATGGYGFQHFYREGENTTGSVAVFKPVPFKNQNYLVSFFGRLNYTYNGKYFLTATLRDDGSSRFAKGNQFGLFPSVALAWRIKDEQFLSHVDFLSDLKLRAGYGVTGQQDISGSNYYPYLSTYQSSDILSQYQLGNTFYTTQRPNPYTANIKWETTATTNLGLDFGFFADKLTGSVDVFQKNTTDLINYIAIPAGVNFSNFVNTNVGNIVNKGIEITLKAVPISTGNLTWNAGLNFTSISSKITKLNLTNDPAYGGVYLGGIGVNANIQNNQVGFPASSFFAYQQVYNANNKPIEGLYVDRSGAGGTVIGSELNKYHYKRPAPDFLIGINSRVNYKKFDFSFSGRISIGNYIYNNVQSGRAFYNGVYTLGYFANVPSAINDTKFNSQQLYSDYYVQNASFFKMDNMSLGYSFDKLGIQRLKGRLSFTVQNAFTITKYKGLDPESTTGIDNNIYPRPRTFLLGLNVTF